MVDDLLRAKFTELGNTETGTVVFDTMLANFASEDTGTGIFIPVVVG